MEGRLKIGFLIGCVITTDVREDGVEKVKEGIVLDKVRGAYIHGIGVVDYYECMEKNGNVFQVEYDKIKSIIGLNKNPESYWEKRS